MLAAHVTRVLGFIHRIAYAFVSPDLIIRRTSENFNSVLSTPGESYINVPLDSVLWEFIGTEENLQAILQGKLPYLAFERVNRQHANGRTTYMDLSVTAVNDQELGRGILIIVEDVTHTAEVEQRLTQNRNELGLAKEELDRANKELQRLDRLKSLFLSMAVHDLRTPLTAIRAYSDLILRVLSDDSPPKVRDFVKLIFAQTNHMDWLINDFLDLDQIEQGEFELHFSEVDVNNLIQQIVDLMSYLVTRKGLELEVFLSPEPMLLQVDDIRIQQVMYNLLSNAIKYTPRGGRIVVESDWDGETAVLRVTDTGIGMTPEEQARAFQLYFRAKSDDRLGESPHNETRGKGLGLFIVKTLVEAHGGHVTLESEYQFGTKITVFLPQDRPSI